jgi:two-component system OmpR family response regulator
MPSIHVLLIEDEKQLQQYASEALSKRGVKVSSAMNTAEADRILGREKVDVIICDILMPAENGLSYVRRLRADGTQTPVIFLSALADEDVIKVGIDSGAADYMIKPFDSEQLYQRILQFVHPPEG